MSDEFVKYFPTDVIQDKTGVLPIKYQSIDAAGNIVAAVAGKIIRVITVIFSTTAAPAAGMIFVSNGIEKSGAFAVVAGTPLVMEFNPTGWADSEVGFALRAGMSAVTANLSISYVEITP